MPIFNKKLLIAGRELTRMSIPVVGSRLTNTLNVLVSMWLMAKLGRQVLAASALISSISLTVLMIVWSVLFSMSILIGNSYGANKFSDVGSIVRQGLIIGTVIGVPTAFLIWNFGPILLLMGQEPHLVKIAVRYFHAYSFSIVPGMWYLCFSQFAVGISKPKLIFSWSIIYFIVTIGVGYGLLFGKWGLPALGVAGMGYAWGIGNVTMCIIIVINLVCCNLHKQYDLFNHKKWWEFSFVRQILDFGWQITAQIAAEFIAFAVATVFMGWLGEHALAARQIVNQVTSVVLMVPYGIAQVSSVLVGQAFGRRDFAAIRYFGYAALGLGVISAILIGMFYMGWPRVIIGLYVDPHLTVNTDIVGITTLLLALTAISQFFDIIRTGATGILRGIYDVRMPMLVSVVSSCFAVIPLSYLLGFPMHLGVVGIALSFILSFAVGAIILICRFYKMTKEYALRTEL